MKNMLIAGLALVLSLVAFAACKNDASKQNAAAVETAAAETKYICPMNCEKGKTYDQPGSCPICHMDLEPVKAGTSQSEYYMSLVATPAQLEAGKSGMLALTPKMKGNESALVPLDLVHEKKMHLILVSDDLSWFDHLHPEYQSSGSYDVKLLAKGEQFSQGRGVHEARFDAGGRYWAFADFKPTGGLNQVDKIEINVAGAAAPAVVYNQPKMSSVVDGFTVILEADVVATGSDLHIPVSIRKAGKPVDPATFENYLGEKAHFIMVESASKAFVHTHPASEKGQLWIHTTLSQPGIYRGWLQFQTDGKVHTADFVIKAGEGKAGAQ